MIKLLDFQSDIYFERAKELNVLADEELTKLIFQDMRDTLSSLEDRVYLCANEIGYDYRVICIKFEDGCKLFINPAFANLSNKKLTRQYYEVTDTTYITPRCHEVVLYYQDEVGNKQSNKFTDDLSVLMCTLIECLDGIHFDYSLEVLPEFDEATLEEQQCVIEEYLKSLDNLYTKLDKELLETEDAKKYWTDYKFRTAVALGEVELEAEPEQKLNRKSRRFIQKLFRKIGGRSNI